MIGDLFPIWHSNACKPRIEILEGTLTEAELALSLSAVVWGRAKPPYSDPVAFFKATHPTKNMKNIFENILGRLSRSKMDVNPIIVLDVGFGGGKTHTLVALFYAVKYGARNEVAPYLEGVPVPRNARVVTISGDEYGSIGVGRGDTQVKTIWGDLFWQLGVYEKFEELDKQKMVPSLEDLRRGLNGDPVLVLLDELPTYLNLVAQDSGMLDKTVQFIQRLVLAISEKEDAALVVAIAEDAYKLEAIRAKHAIAEAVREAMEEVRAHIRRKELVLVPVEEEDVVYILKRRLFDEIDKDVAKKIADAYHQLYSDLSVPEVLKRKTFRDEIEEHYPFHPMLIKVLYERVATIDKFHRTRGALRLLARVVRRIWAEREGDALLIHPFHIDLADSGVVSDLTMGIGEEKRRNALEADIWSSSGNATAQQLDEQSQVHWGAPLVRRACNTIYLYSLATGKEGDRGIQSDLLIALCTTPTRRDHLLRLRDTVLGMLFDHFHYIDRQGERFVFVREPTPLRVIELLARDITEDEATRVLKETLSTFFAGDPSWVYIELFPQSPSIIRDEPFIKVGVLNPNLYTIITGKTSEAVAKFILYKDDHGKRPRQFSNSTFLLITSEDKLEAMRLASRKVSAARMVRDEPIKYGIQKDRKPDVEEYFTRQEKNLNDYIRAAFSNFIYYDRDGIKIGTISASGYGNAKSGRAVIAHYLSSGLQRVKDSPLDPSYVMSYAWPKDAASISTKMLYEQFHAIPGVIIPATKELFQETIKEGIEKGVWVLKYKDKVYTHDKPPTILPIEEIAELYTFEEAERLGLLKKEVIVGKKPGVAVPRPGDQIIESKFATITFAEAEVERLASDLEKRAHRDRFNQVHYLNLKMAGNQLYLLNIKNLLTRISPDKKCESTIQATITRSKSPKFSLAFDMSKLDATREEGKILLDSAWKLKGAEYCEISLTLQWLEGIKTEEATKLLRSLAEGSKEKIIARLEARAERR